MKRLGVSSIFVGCLLVACARKAPDAAPANDKDVPVDSADPEWSGQDLEHQLDRIEQQIKAGVGPDSSAAHDADRAGGRGKGQSDAVSTPGPDGNKSKKSRNGDVVPRNQASGSGSS